MPSNQLILCRPLVKCSLVKFSPLVKYSLFLSFFKNFYLFLLIYFGCAGSWDLGCCMGFFLAAVLGLLTAVASPVVEHGL